MLKKANTIIPIFDSILSLLVIVFIPIMPALFGKNAHSIYCTYIIIVISILVLSLVLPALALILGVKEKCIMDKSNILFIISYILLLIAILFIIFAANNPQMSFIWPLNVSYLIYITYIVTTITIFLAGVVFKIKTKRRNKYGHRV